jgi:hypothetical protein
MVIPGIPAGLRGIRVTITASAFIITVGSECPNLALAFSSARERWGRFRLSRGFSLLEQLTGSGIQLRIQGIKFSDFL